MIRERYNIGRDLSHLVKYVECPLLNKLNLFIITELYRFILYESEYELDQEEKDKLLLMIKWLEYERIQ